MKLHGIIPPVVTPFTPDQELDLPALRRHIDWQLARGVHGILAVDTPRRVVSHVRRRTIC